MAAALIVLMKEKNQNRTRKLPTPRIFRDRTNPLESMTDSDILARYRFQRGDILHLTDLVKDDIRNPTSRSYAVPEITQMLVCLRYLAKGDFQSECGDIHGISQPTVSRIIHRVVSALDLRLQNIQFPTSEHEIVKTKTQFYRLASFPGVIGAIDGTLIPILAPKEDEYVYICRKGYHALNVQGVVDSALRFTNMVCKWPGSVHDSFIFNNSRLREVLERLGNCWLVGDSGYPLKSYLMTPKLIPQTEAEERYNKAHGQTRVVVERAFGVLKSRFRCLHKTGGCLPFSPEKCIKVVSVAMKLHNMCIERKVPLVTPGDDIVDINSEEDTVCLGQDRDGTLQRERLVHLFV